MPAGISSARRQKNGSASPLTKGYRHLEHLDPNAVQIGDNVPSAFIRICTVTRRYDEAIAHYGSQGYELADESSSPGQRVAFFDTVEDFGFFTEVVEEKASFQANLSKISLTCADWDGTDPLRIFTRDGYRTP